MTERLSTARVFTPGKKTTVTLIERDEREAVTKLRTWLRRGGKFIAVVGPTKMGKSVLVEREAPDAFVLQGQTLDSVAALWDRLAGHLGIPVAKSGSTVSGDVTKWGFMAKLGLSPLSLGTSYGGEMKEEASNGWTQEIHADQAVPDAISAILDAKHSVTIVIDDFHFIETDVRREIIQALKPVAYLGASIVLITLPHRRAEAARQVRDVAGRSETVEIPTWDVAELEQIGKKGFPALRLIDAGGSLGRRLAEESYGSPHIMQQLCLELCETVNEVLEEVPELTALEEPDDWTQFFKLLTDETSLDWLTKLGIGPKVRGVDRLRHELADGRSLDGYRVILAALRELGPKLTVPLDELNTTISALLRTGSAKDVSAGAKLAQMSVIAARPLGQTTAEVSAENEEIIDDGDPSSGTPQPVFEFVADPPNEAVHILEPYLAYMLKWHADEFLASH